jgi:hypothetical protein
MKNPSLLTLTSFSLLYLTHLPSKVRSKPLEPFGGGNIENPGDFEIIISLERADSLLSL